VQNSPARLPDVGLGPRVGLPGRRQPAGYGTSWSVLVSSTSGRSGPSNRIYFTIFHPRTSLCFCKNNKRMITRNVYAASLIMLGCWHYDI
jgi:hypothetical protein